MSMQLVCTLKIYGPSCLMNLGRVAFQVQTIKKIHCVILQLITSIVGMSARASKMYPLGTYYNIMDVHSKLQLC